MPSRFSIITVTWNNATGLRRTLDSVRQQTCHDYELIVIDGASTDGTADVIEANRDIITVAVSEKDSGIYNAMNKGITYATGEYVVFMNAGDCFAAADTLSVVSQCSSDIILGGAVYGDSQRMPLPEMTLYDMLSVGINHQSTYYKTELLKRYRFDESYKVIADLKSVVEPMARDKASVSCITSVLSVCEGGGLSKQRWRDALTEKRRIIDEVVDPFYRRDYARMARINNAMLDDFILLSHFHSIFPLLRCVAKVMRFLNNRFKHIPV